MSFPSNAIGFGLTAAGAAYLAYQAEPSLSGGMGFAALSTMNWIVGIALLALGFWFAVILS